MKKIFTLLLAAGAVGIASAQKPILKSNSFDNKHESAMVQTDFRQPGFERPNSSSFDSYSFTLKEKQAQIQKINREFDQKINAVKKNRRLRSSEKSKQVRMLEKQRDEQIRQVEMRYASSKNRWNDNGHSRKW